jgi:hypothetical protein
VVKQPYSVSRAIKHRAVGIRESNCVKPEVGWESPQQRCMFRVWLMERLTT